MTHSQKIDLYIRESRSVSGAKGDSTDKAAEASSAAFATTLQNAFTAQYGKMSATNNFLTSKLTNMVNNPTGFTAPTMAAATTSNIQNAATGAQQATQAAQANEAAHGGTGLPSGVNAQVAGQIDAASENSLSSNQNQLQIANGELQNQNQWSALSGLQNVSNADNPLGFAGASTGAAGNIANMSQAYTASNQSQLEATLGGIVAGVGGAATTAFCPARGSLYLMADGSEKLVEDLQVGDNLTGIDGKPETIEEIQSAVAPVLYVVTQDGHFARNSRTHAFALPFGGFVVAMHSLGSVIKTAKGTSQVINVAIDGKDEVFNVITNGSHTYRADGIWALGVGEAERHVSMDRWSEIGDEMAAGVR